MILTTNLLNLTYREPCQHGLSLPKDVLTLIFNQLSVKDLFQARSVCRTWKKILR